MAEPHWTSYAGMATGIVGSISGIAGLVLAIISYRRANRIKELDLRLELKRAVNKLNVDLDALDKLLPYANGSRSRVAAATGLYNSGAMVFWNTEYESSLALLKQYREQAATFAGSFSGLLPEALEAKLTDVHRLGLLVQQIESKYKASLESDDKEREHLKRFHQLPR